jgi:hypothetical protein
MFRGLCASNLWKAVGPAGKLATNRGLADLINLL